MSSQKPLDRTSDNKGYVIITVALLSVALIGMIALAVDVGALFDARTQAQRVADAAALSGAFSFVVNPIDPQPDTARDYATTTATSQEIMGVQVQPGEVSVDVNVAEQLVTVTIQRNQETYFARVLEFMDAPIEVSAEAEAADSATGSSCTKPWMLPNSVLLPPGSNICNVCPSSPGYDPGLASQVLIQAGTMTPYAASQRGAQFTVKPQTPSQALQPGQFYAIQVSEGSGAAVYRENIATCSGEVFCGSCYGVEPGNMVGPTIQGVKDLTGTPADTFNSEGFCYDPGCRDTSPSLVVVPIWDVCNAIDPGGCQTSGFCPAGKFDDSGANITVRVIGFALIFVEGLQGSSIKARLIDIKTCKEGSGGGGGGGGSGGTVPGPFAVPVRLVRTQ